MNLDNDSKNYSIILNFRIVVEVGDLVSIGFSSENCHLFNGQGQVFEKLAAWFSAILGILPVNIITK